jgi:hypothetical protein
MAEVRSVICDMCGQQPAVTYSIGEQAKTPWIVDLCADCAAPVGQWRDHGRHAGSKRAYRRFTKVPAQPRYAT